MKRSALVRQLEQAGYVQHRRGAKHDVYLNPVKNLKQPILAIQKSTITSHGISRNTLGS